MTLTTTVSADNKQGFDNLEEFGSTLGRTVDTGFNKVIDGINYIFELPNDTKKWTVRK